jgi:hypothetical protein
MIYNSLVQATSHHQRDVLNGGVRLDIDIQHRINNALGSAG